MINQPLNGNSSDISQTPIYFYLHRGFLTEFRACLMLFIFFLDKYSELIQWVFLNA